MYTNCKWTIFIASFKTKIIQITDNCLRVSLINTYRSGAVPYQRLENMKRTEMTV